MMDSLDYIARWLLMFGNQVEVEEPEELANRVVELAEELHLHHVESKIQSTINTK